VIDHLSKLVVVDRTVEIDGVPVALVLVVSRANGGVSSPQLERQPGVTLEVDAARIPVERDQSEHAAAHLEHCNFVAKGVILYCAGQTAAEGQDVIPGHGVKGRPARTPAIRVARGMTETV
jgi:hypothetical protein